MGVLRTSTILVLSSWTPLVRAEGSQAVTSVGEQTEAAYRDLLRQPKRLGWPSKAQYLDNERSKLQRDDSYGYPALIRPEEVPRFVALRAIGLETGSSWPLRPAEARAFARYPASVRRRWSPFAQRLWLEASYDWKTSNLPTVRAEIARLRRLGMDMDALEATLICIGTLNPRNGYEIADKTLRYAEAHPRDVVAAKSAATILYVPTFLAADRRQPLRKDLLDRAFALEGRTIRNQNALLGDDIGSLRTFDILRDTMNGKYARRQ